jgi:hypothetical protein
MRRRYEGVNGPGIREFLYEREDGYGGTWVRMNKGGRSEQEWVVMKEVKVEAEWGRREVKKEGNRSVRRKLE